ncbi:hypothetical protein CMI37_29455, partial [Candidatus Pacearchaeota archaeon]|nr:hypothetical protein [Candidatus Pacearchaeota archaeon]
MDSVYEQPLDFNPNGSQTAAGQARARRGQFKTEFRPRRKAGRHTTDGRPGHGPRRVSGAGLVL